MPAPLRLGGRASKLSLVQADLAAQALARIGIATEYVPINTQGDRDQQSSLRAIGGQGVFARAVEQALRRGDIDVAVHSAKDLPSRLEEGTALAACLPRGDVRDALVTRDGRSLAELPSEAKIGTGSRRRAAQLLRLRPDLQIRDIRGNVDTRLRKLHRGDCDALLLAAAGLQRLQLAPPDAPATYLPIDLVMPAPGQGALALQCRTADAEQLAAAGDAAARRALRAERALLRGLGAGCTLPVGALAATRAGEVILAARLLSLDGSRQIELQRSGEDPEAVGAEVAATLLERGGAALMEQAEGAEARP